MSQAFGIVNFAGNHIQVDGLQEYRPVGLSHSSEDTV